MSTQNTGATQNGRGGDKHDSLLNSLQAFGLPAVAASTKDEMRELAIRGPRSPEEWSQLMCYCEEDVNGARRLFQRLAEERTFSLPHALFRGRYFKAVARMEMAGVPLDVVLHRRLVNRWEIKALLGREMNDARGRFRRGEGDRTPCFD